MPINVGYDGTKIFEDPSLHLKEILRGQICGEK